MVGGKAGESVTQEQPPQALCEHCHEEATDTLTSPHHRTSKTLTIIVSPRVRATNMVTQGGGRGREEENKNERTRRRTERKKEDITHTTTNHFFVECLETHITSLHALPIIA